MARWQNQPNTEKREQVISLRMSGMTYKQIANAIGHKNESWVMTVCRENGLGGTSAWKDKRYAEMREYKAQGHTMAEVAERFGVSDGTATNVCKGIAPQNKTQYTKVCAICGREFVTERYNTRYCSSVCRNTKRDWKHNHRVSDDKRIDKGINARSLYKRDKGVCWICGGQCDLNDYITKNGYFVAGDWYPSVDHIVPVCDGGTDEWTNVKLAHRICNSRRFYAEKTNPIA